MAAEEALGDTKLLPLGGVRALLLRMWGRRTVVVGRHAVVPGRCCVLFFSPGPRTGLRHPVY